MTSIEAALLRSLCYTDSIEYAPTVTEWIAWLELEPGNTSSYEEVVKASEELVASKRVFCDRGRVVLPGQERFIALREERAVFLPRKLRAAKNVTRWLRRLHGVRFVALCNTTALGYARDLGDLDFFVVTRANTVWQTRGWAALPFKLANRRPRNDQEIADAVCLSFFIDETALNLEPLSLTPTDPYLRYWFLSLLPLYDDGVGQSLWKENEKLRGNTPFAIPWMVNPDLQINPAHIRIPSVSFLDQFARRAQEQVLPTEIQTEAGDTSVVRNAHVLKFHTQDARAEIRARYEARCRDYGLLA